MIMHACVVHDIWSCSVERDQFSMNNNLTQCIVDRQKNFSEQQQQQFIVILRFAAAAPHQCTLAVRLGL
jgi:hypothetical protein